MSDREVYEGAPSPVNHRDISPRGRSYSRSRTRSRSYSRSRSRSRSYSPYRRNYRRSGSRSPAYFRGRPRSRSCSRSYSRSRSRSRSPYRRRRRSYSRSRSRSPYYRRRSYSRSRSRSPYYRRRYNRRWSRSRSRSPMSDRRRHQGDRYNPDVNRCIGVFGLSLYTGEKDLREIFEEYGRIEEIQVVYDHQTGRSRGFAFVYFQDLNDAIEAKERCNGIEIDGRRIRVDYSITKRAHTPTPGVYMGRPTSKSSREWRGGDRYDDDYGRYGGGGGGGGRYY